MYKKSKNIISNNLMISLILPAFVSCNTKPKDESKGADSETEIDYQKVDPLKIDPQILKKAGVGKINSDFLDEDAKFNEDEYIKKKDLFPVTKSSKTYIKSDGTIDVEKVTNEITKDQLEKLIGEKKEALSKKVIFDIIKSDPRLKSLVDAQIIEFNGTIFTINNSNKVGDPKKVTTGQVGELSLEVLAEAFNKAFETYTGNGAKIAEVKEEGGNKSVQINAEVLLRDKKIISEGKNPFFDPKDGKPIEKAQDIAEKNPELFKEIILRGQGTEKLNEIFSSVNSKVSSIETLKDPKNEKDFNEAISKAQIFNKSLYKDMASSQEIAKKMIFSAEHKGVEILSDPVIDLNGVDVSIDAFKKCFGDQMKSENYVTEKRSDLAKPLVGGGGVPVNYLPLTNNSFDSMKKGEEKYYYSLEDDKNETFYLFKVKCKKEYVAANTKTGVAETKGEYQVTKTLCKKAEHAEAFSQKFINETKKEDIWKLRKNQLKENAAIDTDVAKEIAAIKDEEFFKELTKDLGLGKEYTAEELKNALSEVILHASALEVLKVNDTNFDSKAFVDTAVSDANGVSKVRNLLDSLIDYVKKGTENEHKVSNPIVLSALQMSFSKLKDLAGGSEVAGQVDLANAAILDGEGSKIDSIEVSKVDDNPNEFIISLCLKPKQVVDADNTLDLATSNELRNQDVTRAINNWICNRNNGDLEDDTILISTKEHGTTAGGAGGTLSTHLDCKAGRIAGAIGNTLAGIKLKRKEKGEIKIVNSSASLQRNDTTVDVPFGTRLLGRKKDNFTLKLNFLVDSSKKIDATDFLKKIYTSVEFQRYFGISNSEEEEMIKFESAFDLDQKNRKDVTIGGGMKAKVCTLEFIGKDLAQS